MADAFGRVETGDIALIFDSMAVRNGDGDFIKNHNERRYLRTFGT